MFDRILNKLVFLWKCQTFYFMIQNYFWGNCYGEKKQKIYPELRKSRMELTRTWKIIMERGEFSS